MALENGKWRVVRGDCLWNICKAVYNDPYRWRDVANANGISQQTALIYPGQLLILPGKSSGGPTPVPPQPTYSTKVTIQWWALDAGTTRDMFCTWSYNRSGTRGFEIKWEYNTGTGGWRTDGTSTTTLDQAAYSAPENAKEVRLTITPKSESWGDGGPVTVHYNFANNPPEIPAVPSIEIDIDNKLTSRIDNLPETLNADSIEFTIYQDDTIKYKVIKTPINIETLFVEMETMVDAGHDYKIRCRGVRGAIFGGYTEFTERVWSLPIAPSEITTLRSEKINEQIAITYGIFAEWEDVPSAETYLVQWATNKDFVNPQSQATEEGEGPRLLLTGISLGLEYYFRVASLNTQGQSIDWSAVKTVTLGTRPSAPTTYSNVESCVLGEDLNLYWVHNSTDGSFESYARLNLEISDSAHPELEPMIINKVIKNEKPEEEKGRTSVYTINTNDPEWVTVGEGFLIKWKVQTAGVTSEYSEWSTQREVSVYAKPEVEIDIKNNVMISVDEINSFPFYIDVLATPPSQIPISYYVEIVANQSYETIDDIGKIKMVNVGDKIYQKYYDPQSNPWHFLLEMSPNNLDLENNVTYTINVTLSMNSGLIAKLSKTFTAYFQDLYYDVYADILFNKDTLEATIKPSCYQYLSGIKELVPNCTLSVFRRQYDGTFIEISSGVENTGIYVLDPHPSLDYGRYRIVAKMNDTGAISFADVKPLPINYVAAVIQWDEPWSSYAVGENGEGMIDPPWSGSMCIIPYNVTISDTKSIDVSLIEYAGRENPVSYYGTHIGESSSWSMVIPKSNKELLNTIRRLSKWKGDVYVREPYGTGYWANISVSYNLKYSDVTIPVTMNIKRVEGGI